MKYWYDTEFIDNGQTIDLISIGIVAEDGREYYAVSNEFSMYCLTRNEWLVEHVLPTLPIIKCAPGCRCLGGRHIDVDHPSMRSRGQIARGVHDFLTVDDDPQLWSWYPSYDHVVLAQLWGPMQDLPPGIPKRTSCIGQLADGLRVSEQDFPPASEGLHNALVDARYHKQLYDYVINA